MFDDYFTYMYIDTQFLFKQPIILELLHIMRLLGQLFHVVNFISGKSSTLGHFHVHQASVTQIAQLRLQ